MIFFVIVFTCLVVYYVYRSRLINDIEFYILLLLFLIILISLRRLEQFTVIEGEENKTKYIVNINSMKKKFNTMKKTLNSIMLPKIKDNSIQIKKLFSSIKQKLNGYQI